MQNHKRPKAKIADKRRNTTMTFRTNKMIESLTEVAARSKGISVSEYLETSTKTSFDNVMVNKVDLSEPNESDASGNLLPSRMSEGQPLSELIDDLYDDDDVTCLFKRLYMHSWALNREQFRLLKLIQISPLLYPKVGIYNERAIREHWDVLNAVANGNAPIETLPAGMFGNADIEFALMTEAEQVALYRTSAEEFFRRSQSHLSKTKRGKA